MFSKQTVASLRRHTDLRGIAAALDEGFATVVHAVGAAGGTPVGAPFVAYHAVIDESTSGEIDICVPIADDLRIEGEAARIEVPAQLVASTVHRGPYDELAPAYHTLTGWIAEHGHRAAGPPSELYLNDPGEVPPEELLTEVQWPLESEMSRWHSATAAGRAG